MSSLEVKNGDIWQAWVKTEDGKLVPGALQTLVNTDMPQQPAYALAKLARKVGDQFALVNQVRVKLIQQYGTGGTFNADSEHYGQFLIELDELMSTTVELENVWRVKLPSDKEMEARELKPLALSAQVLMLLEPFVEVEVEGEES